MSASFQPITVWGKGGPNPPKAAIVLAELGIPHNIIPIPLSDVKNPDYVAINPNGRIPAIHDPNTNITLWESGAIVEYIVDKYDTDHKISFPAGTAESYHTKQWLYYQVSGQGPYFGQASWFKKFHPEKVPSAVERYVGEINRVTTVLDKYLAAQKEKYAGSGSDGPWLVGDKYSYADFSFIPWYFILPIVVKKEDGYDVDNYPNVKDWIARISARPAVAKVLGDIQPVK